MPSQFIACVDCGSEFEYTERDQEFFQERGYTSPKRCKPCRNKKKAARGNDQRREEGY